MESTCTSEVLLGVFDSSCPSPHLSPYENKIGGYPDCYVSCPLALSSLPVCSVCGSTLCLLVQVYCPLENTLYHRTIYVFSCEQPSCHKDSKSWLVLRSQCEDESISRSRDEFKPATISKTNLMAAADWCAEANDWESDDHDDLNTKATGDSIEKQMELLAITGTGASTASEETPTHHTTYSAPFYPPAYLSVIEEPSELSLGKDIHHARILLKKYQSENGLELCEANKVSVSCRGKASGGEGYEKAAAKHGDRAFQKFHKRLGKCPQQLIRYNRGGEPLLITYNPPPKPSETLCNNCGAPCVFELQLMPTLVYSVQLQLVSQHLGSTGSTSLRKENMPDFGTVLVYTCSKSCWTDSSLPRVEVAIIQIDDC